MIDPFTIKPLDKKTILENARATKGRIITVEDHYHEGKQSIGGQSVQSIPPGSDACSFSYEHQKRSMRPRADALVKTKSRF